jgi:hypothetical protein
MSLYRATRNPSASEGACGYTTAEEAAVEETSVDRQIRLCPCIAYRYKNTCEHVAANLPGGRPYEPEEVAATVARVCEVGGADLNGAEVRVGQHLP